MAIYQVAVWNMDDMICSLVRPYFLAPTGARKRCFFSAGLRICVHHKEHILSCPGDDTACCCAQKVTENHPQGRMYLHTIVPGYIAGQPKVILLILNLTDLSHERLNASPQESTV